MSLKTILFKKNAVSFLPLTTGHPHAAFHIPRCCNASYIYELYLRLHTLDLRTSQHFIFSTQGLLLCQFHLTLIQFTQLHPTCHTLQVFFHPHTTFSLVSIKKWKHTFSFYTRSRPTIFHAFGPHNPSTPCHSLLSLITFISMSFTLISYHFYLHVIHSYLLSLLSPCHSLLFNHISHPPEFIYILNKLFPTTHSCSGARFSKLRTNCVAVS